MKILVEKLLLSQEISFVVQTYRTPLFEVPWHQHVELELIMFKEGNGMSFIGNHVGSFDVDDIFLLGANIPHTFQKSGDQVVSALVVQFREDFWGAGFLALPESKALVKLFKTALQGLKITGESKAALKPLLLRLEQESGLMRIIRLCECLHEIAANQRYLLLSTKQAEEGNVKHRERIDQIFRFTLEHFKSRIAVSEVAELAGLSVPAFCSYFKKSTKKTYVDFLNETRIGYAGKLLQDTADSITSICFESGFNTLAHFNTQFRKFHGIAPSQYRKAFLKTEQGKPLPAVSREISEPDETPRKVKR